MGHVALFAWHLTAGVCALVCTGLYPCYTYTRSAPSVPECAAVRDVVRETTNTSPDLWADGCVVSASERTWHTSYQ